MSGPKRKIALVETSDLSVESHLDGLLSHLRDEGWQVTVLSNDDGRLLPVSRRNKVDALALPMNREPSLGADIRSLVRLVWAIRAINPDLVNYGTPKASLLTAIAAFICRTPVRVYTVHGLRFETMKGPARVAYQVIEKIVVTLSTHVVCVSKSSKDALSSLVASPDKIRVLGHGSANGVDIARYKAAGSDYGLRSRMRETYGVAHDDIVIGFLGRITRDKGIDELVRAFSTLSRRESPKGSVKLLIAGDREGWGTLMASTQSVIEENPNVIMTGYVESSEFLSAVDVICLPSYREGLPTVLLEAAAAGRSIVASDCTGAVDLIQNQRTGRVVPMKDAASLAAALWEAAQEVDNGQLSSNAYSMVCERYSQEKVWVQWESYFSSLFPVGVK